MMTDVLAAVLAHLDAAGPGGVVGLYLHGSGVEQLHAAQSISCS